jgi:hypothetical protein
LFYRRSLRVQASTINAGSTERERGLFYERKDAVYQRFRAWEQRSPIEGDVNDQDEANDENEGDLAIDISTLQLPLPSTIPGSGLVRITHLRHLEKRLRIGQCHDAVKQLRKALGLRLALRKSAQEIHGQRDTLRSRATIKRVDKDVDVAISRYRAAYSALKKLGIKDAEEGLQELQQSDISTSNVFQFNRPVGRGYDTKDVTWIWRMRGVGLEAQDDNWFSEGTYFVSPIHLITILVSDTRSVS